LIKSEAIDANGNRGYAYNVVVLDTSPPNLDIYTPEEGTTTTSNTILVEGYAEAGTLITINDTVVTNESTGFFSSWVILDGQEVILEIAATDEAGNTSTVTRTIYSTGVSSRNQIFLPMILP
jgi:bacillopeptidase F